MIDPKQLGLSDLEKQHGLPSGLLEAVMHAESAGNPNAVSSAGAQGLFQFMPKTAKAYGINPFDPQQAAIGAARMYGDLNKQYKGDVPSMLAAYNWGSGNIQNKGMENMPQETRDYIAKVTRTMGAPSGGSTVTKYTPTSNEATIPAPPPGFVLEEIPTPPAGFVIENQPETIPPPPPGYVVVDEAQPTVLETPLSKFAPKETSIGRTILEQGLGGATFNLADEVYNRLGAVGAKIYDKTLGDNVTEGQSIGDLIDEASGSTKLRMEKQFEERLPLSIASNIGGALLTGGAGATTKGGATLTNSLRSGKVLGKELGLLGRGAKAAAVGSTSGGLAGFGSGSGVEDRFERGATGAKVGAVVGSGAPVVGAAASKVGQTILPKVDTAVKPLANRARELGISLRIDQVAPSRVRNTVQKVSQSLPFSGAGDFETTQATQWHKALSKTLGLDTDVLGPEAINSFLTGAQKKWSGILKGQKVRVGTSTTDKLDSILAEASDSVTGDIVDVIRRNVESFKKDIAGGVVNGEKLSSLRSQLIKRAAKVTGEAKPYIHDMIEAIDDVILPNIPKEKGKILKQARQEWRNFKTIEPLLEKSTDGKINPTELMNRVASSPYIKSARTAVGKDDLVDLAKIGKQFMPKKGGSDTFEKTVVGGGTGALGITALADPLLAVATGLKGGAALLANRGLQKYNSSQKIVDKIIERPTNAQSEFLKRYSQSDLGRGLAKYADKPLKRFTPSGEGSFPAIAAPTAGGYLSGYGDPTKILINPDFNPYAGGDARLPEVELPKTPLQKTKEKFK